MLNICAKFLLRRSKPLAQSYRVIALHNYATFSSKDILYETSDEAGTLITRFAKHVALERQKICEQVPSRVRYSDYFPVSDIKYFQKELEKTDKEQLSAVITFAFTYRPNADPYKFSFILNELDRYAVKNIKEMNADTVLRTLYAFLFLIPNWMIRLDFYGKAMQHLFDEFNKQDVQTKEEFLQLCFYMGLSKKQIKFNVNNLLSTLLDKYIDKYIDEMSTLDLALVSNAAFKTAVVVKSEAFNQRLLKEVLDISDTSDGNDALLVNFLKSMRLQRLRSPKVCEYIENISQDGDKLRQLQPRGQIHLFTYLAENLWDNKICTQPIIETVIEQLALSRRSNVDFSQKIRAKDISTFLWSCTQLNCSLTSVQLRNIENSLLEKVDDGEFNFFVDQLVESCLSLWTLGHKSKELLQTAVKLKSESKAQRKQPKVDSRLTTLLSVAQIEEPSWCSTVIRDFEAFNPKAQIPSHLSIQDIPYQEIIDELLKEEIVSSAEVSCPINGINIPGIHVKLSSPSESEIFLEFMSPAQTLHFSKEPVFILRLKLRLLQFLGYKVKVVSSTDAQNTQSIKDALRDITVQEEIVKESSESSIKA